MRIVYRKGGEPVAESFDFFESDPQVFDLDPSLLGGDLGYAHYLSHKTLLHIGKFLR